MKYNLFLYGAAAFVLFRYLKKRQNAAGNVITTSDLPPLQRTSL
jgi:hypothetical protein